MTIGRMTINGPALERKIHELQALPERETAIERMLWIWPDMPVDDARGILDGSITWDISPRGELQVGV